MIYCRVGWPTYSLLGYWWATRSWGRGLDEGSSMLQNSGPWGLMNMVISSRGVSKGWHNPSHPPSTLPTAIAAAPPPWLPVLHAPYLTWSWSWLLHALCQSYCPSTKHSGSSSSSGMEQVTGAGATIATACTGWELELQLPPLLELLCVVGWNWPTRSPVVSICSEQELSLTLLL